MAAVRLGARRCAGNNIALWIMLTVVAFGLLGSGCSLNTGDAESAPDASISVIAGSYSTTVRPGETTDVPFAEAVLVDVTFDDPVYGPSGRNSLRVEVDPTSYRIQLRDPQDRNTISFALIRNRPGTVTVSVFRDSDSEPVEFTLNISADS